MRRFLIVALMSVCLGLLADEALLEEVVRGGALLCPNVSAEFQVGNGTVARSQVFTDRPVQENTVVVNWKLGEWGRVGFLHWDMNMLSGRVDNLGRRPFMETDWGLFYGYDWQLAEDWTLSNEAMVYWMCYHGMKVEAPTDIEYDFSQSLANPYATPYWRLRCGTATPSGWLHATVGLKRSFEVCDRLTLTPSVFCGIGNGTMMAIRSVEDPHSSLMDVNVQLRADVPLNEQVGIFCLVRQFTAMSHGLRDVYGKPHPRDLTIGALGVTVNF